MINRYTKKPQYVDVLSSQQWRELDSIFTNIYKNSPSIIEQPELGDSRNEQCHLDVVRFITRKNHISNPINLEHTKKILKLFKHSDFIKKIKMVAGIKKELKIIRMQLNSMKEGAFVGLHTDIESDPAYVVTALLRTEGDFTGGELCIHEPARQLITQKKNSVLIINPSSPHEVLKVENGERDTLVVLMGTQ